MITKSPTFQLRLSVHVTQGELLKKRNKMALALPRVNVRVAHVLGSLKSQGLLKLFRTGIEFRSKASSLLLSKPEQPLLLSCRFFFCR